jgi:hypothetical protein
VVHIATTVLQRVDNRCILQTLGSSQTYRLRCYFHLRQAQPPVGVINVNVSKFFIIRISLFIYALINDVSFARLYSVAWMGERMISWTEVTVG